MKNNQNNYDVIIIGAGVSGSAQAYILSKYTDCKNVAVFEKEKEVGGINSNKKNNSQTLHEGEIETNYNYEKAILVKHKAYFTRKYVTSKKNNENLFIKGGRMVLGVGDGEVRFLKERYEKFKDIFDGLKFLDKYEIEKIEPNIIQGRDPNENIAVIYREGGLTIDYGLMSKELISDAMNINNSIDIFSGVKVNEIKKLPDGGFSLETDNGIYTTKILSICAGGHSMYFAKKLKLDSSRFKSLLCVAGNFYYTKKVLNNKVYTVQNPLLPFSAVHGDPDLIDKTKTRYGPTTRVVFQLERGSYNTVLEFFITLTPVFGIIKKYIQIMSDKHFFFYALKQNIIFQIPFLGNYLFAKEIMKIIPTIKREDVDFAKGQGGVRPQIIDIKDKLPFSLGEAKFEDKNLLINVTPSPGATTSVYNAIVDVKKMSNMISFQFKENDILRDFEIDKI